jgi:hypothetical protein
MLLIIMVPETLLLAVGDVAPRRPDPDSMFSRVKTHLQRADVVFGQLETTLSERGAPVPQTRLAMRSAPATANAMRAAGFGIVSFAGNHCMDWGSDAFHDTLTCTRAAGLEVCGAGATIEAARAPVIVEKNGLRCAFLAYSSVLPQGYWAESNRPGCAPIRAFTIYEQVEHDQPGTPSRTHTFAHREDLAALCEDVRRAREAADFVAVSLHWGIHFVPYTIADYQRDVARAAIDSGAHVILGHRPHILKGIEIYRGKPIFYSLGNFAIEQPMAFANDVLASRGFQEISALNPGFQPREKYISPPDTQKSIVARLTLRREGIAEIAFLPTVINDDAEPAILDATDPRFAEVLSYVERCSRSQQMNVAFRACEDRVVVKER